MDRCQRKHAVPGRLPGLLLLARRDAELDRVTRSMIDRISRVCAGFNHKSGGRRQARRTQSVPDT